MCTESFTKIVMRIKEKNHSLEYAVFRNDDPKTLRKILKSLKNVLYMT